MEGDGRRRVFFALWPGEAERLALQRFVHALDTGGQPVPRAHLHLTLAFAGTVTAVQMEQLTAGAAAAAVGGSRFLVQLDWLDHFQGARVQWLGPATAPDALRRLAGALTRVCENAGVVLRSGPYRPHVTLHRHVSRPVRGAVAPALPWWVSDFVLVESGSGGRPGGYRVVARWPLANPAEEAR